MATEVKLSSWRAALRLPTHLPTTRRLPLLQTARLVLLQREGGAGAADLDVAVQLSI